MMRWTIPRPSIMRASLMAIVIGPEMLLVITVNSVPGRRPIAESRCLMPRPPRTSINRTRSPGTITVNGLTAPCGLVVALSVDRAWNMVPILCFTQFGKGCPSATETHSQVLTRRNAWVGPDLPRCQHHLPFTGPARSLTDTETRLHLHA